MTGFKRVTKNKTRDKNDKTKSPRDRSLPAPRSKLPPVLVVEVVGLTEEGEPLGTPINWEDSRREPPRVLLQPGAKGQTPGIGDRVLAKLQPGGRKYTLAQIIRVLPEASAKRVLGVFQKIQEGGILRPVNRKQKQEFFLPKEECDGIKAGDLILAELEPKHRNRMLGMPQAKVSENYGPADSPGCFSLIAAYHHEIPTEFPEAALAEAQAAPEITPEGRTDLREIPLVTIDGKDARDFDDAVFAEAHQFEDGSDGWHLLVAIADVAHYVTPGSALDKEAITRGNSVYFPDRVVPMLPEALSNGLCSLNPDEDRYCLAAHLWISAEGIIQRYEFVRGIMRSHARLIYEQVQDLWNTQNPDWLPVLAPLYGAYHALLKHREERGALELDLPEYEISLGDDGKVASVSKRSRVDSHKLIEEFMIAANVAAADAIEHHGTDGIFRIHEPPTPSRVEELRNFLRTLEHSLSADARAKHYNSLLSKVAEKPEAALVNTAVLRSQTQAYYSPNNKGHFGLGLEKYCHFTSPIRRYSDLVVHRALIALLHLDGQKAPKQSKEQQNSLSGIADHISQTERRAMQAEREATDRYVTAYLSSQLRADFTGVITSVGTYGMFVTLDETGASGIIRMSELGRDFYQYDERHHSLIGRDTGERFQLGQRVTVTLIAADVTLGSLRFGLISAQKLPPLPKLPYRGKPKRFERRDDDREGKKPFPKGKGRFDREDRGDRPDRRNRDKGETSGSSGKGRYEGERRERTDDRPKGKFERKGKPDGGRGRFEGERRERTDDRPKGKFERKGKPEGGKGRFEGERRERTDDRPKGKFERKGKPEGGRGRFEGEHRERTDDRPKGTFERKGKPEGGKGRFDGERKNRSNAEGKEKPRFGKSERKVEGKGKSHPKGKPAHKKPPKKK